MKKLTFASIAMATVLGASLSSAPSFANFLEAGKSISANAIHLVTVKIPSGQSLRVSVTGSFGRGTGSACQYSKVLDGGKFSAYDGEILGINGGPLSQMLGAGFTCGKMVFEVSSLQKTVPDKFQLIWNDDLQQYTDTDPHQSMIVLGINP